MLELPPPATHDRTGHTLQRDDDLLYRLDLLVRPHPGTHEVFRLSADAPLNDETVGLEDEKTVNRLAGRRHACTRKDVVASLEDERERS